MAYSRGLIGTYRQFWEDEPDRVVGSASQWFHRTQNAVIGYLEGPAGAKLSRVADTDEYFVLALSSRVRVTAGTESAEGGPGSVFIVPPGDSEVELLEEGSVWTGFTTAAADLLQLCQNETEYEPPVEHIAPVTPMGEPVGGYALRHYDLTAAPDGPRCFVHRTAMVKFRWPFRQEPRDPEKMSPHDHEDFEQASLFIRGTAVHHMRRHWGRNSREWLPDEHQVVVAPAVAISKPPDIHTTRAVTRGEPVGWVDFYSPVRWDILQTGGMITNDGIYPPPETIPETLSQRDYIYAADDPRRALETRGADTA